MNKHIDNQAAVGRCLQIVKTGLSGFLPEFFPGERVDDVAHTLKLVAYRWNEISGEFPRKARSLAYELIDIRNEWAHQAPISDDDARRAFDTAERFLRALTLEEVGEEVKKLRDPIKEDQVDDKEQAPRVFRVSKMSTVRPPAGNGCHEKLLRNVRFSDEPRGTDYPCLMERLASVTDQVYGRVEMKSGSIARQFAPLDFKWVNESRIVPASHDREENLKILLHIGDTKEQGRRFFDINPNGISWPEKIAGHKLHVRRYIKVANAYASALLWILPTEAESLRTHTKKFFEEFSGSVARNDWENFDSRLAMFVANWRGKCFIRDGGGHADWDNLVTAKNYTKFLISVGTNLSILIPYSECQNLDMDVYNSKLAIKYREILEEIKGLVERPVKSRLG